MKDVFALALLCGASAEGFSQNGDGKLDSIQHVREVVVVSRPSSREVVPAQRLGGEQLDKLSTHSVADALRYFSGVQIKDYGGVGGVKTVNIRSMGSSHLGVFYDGIELGNAQNGQVDLGQFALDNVEEITLYNGQKSAIFQPAADFGTAGSVYIRTRVPQFVDGRIYNLKVKAKYGSSDLFSMSAVYERKLSRSVCASVNVGGLTSSGKYKFRYYRKNTDGSTAYDTTAVRQNGDIWALRAETNVYGTLSGGKWGLKAYTYHSERGIPGAIVNNNWHSGERQGDHNTFFQGYFQRNAGERFSSRLLMKYAYYNTHYLNTDTAEMPADNTYRQQEFYVSSANMYDIMPFWSVSLSYDFRWNKLDADMPRFVYPHRFTNMLSVATALDLPHFKLQGSLLSTFVKDHTRIGADRKSVSTFTPAVFVNVYPFSGKVISLRAFAKKSFRMPTFNDLYYTDVGNAALSPEAAIQYNIGCVADKYWSNSFFRHVRFQVDGYYNTVHDKIVAFPQGKQFRWTMLNLGKVHIKGVDADAEAVFCPVRELMTRVRLQYTFQNACDVTSRADSYYDHQIPYVPWHSGSVILGVSYRAFDLNYSFIYVGERYSQKENTLANHMQPWYTSDMSLMYRLNRHGKRIRFTLEVNNIFSQDYDVIANYPMPKRNYALAVNVDM